MASRRVSLGVLLLLAAVSGLRAVPARAEDFKIGEDPVSAVMKWRPTTPDPEVQDFVRASRPAGELDYKPLTGSKVDRPKLKSKKDLKAMVDDMDGRADALHRRGGVAGKGGNATARQLQAAGAESRRRAAEAFGSAQPTK